jgi:pimeloyl-ACP methyl ester carboxylesterase
MNAESLRKRTERGLIFERRGSGRPIVFVHGWCLNRELWTYAEEALVDSFELITPDLPGFGESAALAPPYSLDRYAEELSRFLAELELSDAIVVGFAFGAAVGMKVSAAGSPQLGGLVAIGAPSAAHSPYERMPNAMKRDWPDFAMRSGAAICKQPQSDSTLQWLGRMFGATPLRTALATVAELGRFEPAEIAAEMTVPTLYVHGAQDDVVPLAISEQCAAAAEDSELAVVPDCGHLVPIDQKEPFHELVREFAGRSTS